MQVVVVSTRFKENSTTSDISRWTYSPANGNFLLLWLQCSSFSQFRVKRLPFVICSPGWPQEFPVHWVERLPSSAKQMSKLLSLLAASPDSVLLSRLPTRSGFVNAPQFWSRCVCSVPRPLEVAAPLEAEAKIHVYSATQRQRKTWTDINFGRIQYFSLKVVLGVRPRTKVLEPGPQTNELGHELTQNGDNKVMNK